MGGVGPGDVEMQRCGTALAQRVECSGDLAGDAGAHQDIVDPGQDGPVQGRQIGKLNLRHEVDPNGVGVPFLREAHLDKGTQDAHVESRLGRAVRMHGQAPVRLPRPAATGAEVALQHVLHDGGDWETSHRTTDMAAGVAVLKAADEHSVDRGSGDHPEVAARGDGAGKSPARDAHAHPALNQARETAGDRVRHGDTSGWRLRRCYGHLQSCGVAALGD